MAYILVKAERKSKKMSSGTVNSLTYSLRKWANRNLSRRKYNDSDFYRTDSEVLHWVTEIGATKEKSNDLQVIVIANENPQLKKGLKENSRKLKRFVKRKVGPEINGFVEIVLVPTRHNYRF